MKAIIDRIEDDTVVLSVGGDEVLRRIPRSRFPWDVREGQVVDLDTLEVDEVETEQAQNRVEGQLEALKAKRRPRGDFDL